MACNPNILDFIYSIVTGRLHYSLTPKRTTMGTISKGIMGGFSGTVGTVIGGTWKGINYIRSKPDRRTSKPTEKQLEQQAKFAAASKFIQPLNGLVTLTFRNYAVKMTGVNSALSHVLKNAVMGTYPTYTIDYEAVLISRGDLPNALNPVASAVATNSVKFDWTDNSSTGKAKAGDNSILVIYSPEDKLALYTTGGTLRSAGTATFNASIFSGQQVETYIGFISEDGKDIATSIYTGAVTLVS